VIARPTLAALRATFPRAGRVEWIGIRDARRAPVRRVAAVTADTARGLHGDHYSGRSGTRHVTLIQAEHLTVIARLMSAEHVDPALLRRNLVVSGINLLALKGTALRVGNAVLEITGQCHPCSRMEEVLGPGGYNVMRGHGGMTARVVRSGNIALGDSIAVAPADAMERKI
jgi:MOSC domain-containing protein YiiM